MSEQRPSAENDAPIGGYASSARRVSDLTPPPHAPGPGVPHSADYDALGLPVDCGEPHPVTGNGCVEPRGHEGLHRAMGTVRMQGFGVAAGCVTPPESSAR